MSTHPTHKPAHPTHKPAHPAHPTHAAHAASKAPEAPPTPPPAPDPVSEHVWTDEDEKAYLAKCEKAKRTAAIQRSHDLIDQVSTQSGRGQPHRNQTNLEEKARDFIKAVEAETFVKIERE